MRDSPLTRHLSPRRDYSFGVLWILGIVAITGCSIVPRHSRRRMPVLAEPSEPRHSLAPDSTAAELLYAEAVRLESLAAEECIDLYYQAAAHAWNRIEDNVRGAGPPDARQWHLYHSALTKLLMTAERFNRFNQHDGLLVTTADGTIHVPIEYHAFPWTPADFRVLSPVGKYPADSTSRGYRRDGLGVSLMARASPNARPFVHSEQIFAATAVLRPTSSAHDPHGLRSFTLAFYNPLNTFSIQVDDAEVTISQDITAPIAFSYDTGAPFLEGASALRRQLGEIRTTLDPDGTDPALEKIVLIGHSMGGLVSKLQITSSSDTLWSSVSTQPLQAINASPETRQELAEYFFFEPSPAVSRAVFIGTPHRGSGLAQRSLGKLGSALVKQPEETKQQHRQLIQANPGVFSREVQDRIPTSIDLLEPDSPLLNAIADLPVRFGVELHSIVGTGYWMPHEGDSDKVVPVSSASLPNVSSEVLVDAKHTEVHHKMETVHEVGLIFP